MFAVKEGALCSSDSMYLTENITLEKNGNKKQYPEAFELNCDVKWKQWKFRGKNNRNELSETNEMQKGSSQKLKENWISLSKYMKITNPALRGTPCQEIQTSHCHKPLQEGWTFQTISLSLERILGGCGQDCGVTQKQEWGSQISHPLRKNWVSSWPSASFTSLSHSGKKPSPTFDSSVHIPEHRSLNSW